MANALGTPGGVVTDEDHRLALAGLIAAQTSTLAVRTGVLVAPGSAALVTGTSATGTMTVAVAPFHAISTRGTADGVYLGTLAASTTVNIAAAPGSNSRIDVVYAKQNDSGSTISPDGSIAYVVDKVTGTAAASPTKPAIPAGGVELATVTVAAGATATNGAGVTISNTALQVSARGAAVPCRTQAERDALTTYPGLVVVRIDTGTIEIRNSGNSGWNTVRLTSTTDSAFTLAASISGAVVGSGWDVTGLRFARKDGQLFVEGIAGKATWTNGEVVVTLPAGWRPQRETEWFARIVTTYYVLRLGTDGGLRIGVANTAGTIDGSAVDVFAVIGTPTLLA